jgi:hypothetical protein
MSRPRTFTKAEIMDAARAAAETGLSAQLQPTGDILFFRDMPKRGQATPTPEDALGEWLNARKAGGHP